MGIVLWALLCSTHLVVSLGACAALRLELPSLRQGLLTFGLVYGVAFLVLAPLGSG